MYRVAFVCIVVIGASPCVQGQSIAELKSAGNVTGLMAKLGDDRAVVRREAAFALPEVIDKVDDQNVLNAVIWPLLDVRFRDPWKATREYAGRSLMSALQRTKDQVVLINCVQPLVDALDQGQVELDRRRYAALALSTVAIKLERVERLQPRMAELLASALKDPDEGVRKYAQRALQHTLQKADDEPALKMAAVALAGQLESMDPHIRSFAATMLSGAVRRINDRETLKSLLGPVTAATKDADQGVRDYAGRTLQYIQHALKPQERPAATAKETQAAVERVPATRLCLGSRDLVAVG